MLPVERSSHEDIAAKTNSSARLWRRRWRHTILWRHDAIAAERITTFWTNFLQQKVFTNLSVLQFKVALQICISFTNISLFYKFSKRPKTNGLNTKLCRNPNFRGFGFQTEICVIIPNGIDQISSYVLAQFEIGLLEFGNGMIVRISNFLRPNLRQTSQIETSLVFR